MRVLIGLFRVRVTVKADLVLFGEVLSWVNLFDRTEEVSQAQIINDEAKP